jgi:hypothetical protein
MRSKSEHHMNEPRRSRWFTAAAAAAVVTLVLILVTPWYSMGRVQSLGPRSVALGFEDGRMGLGLSDAGGTTSAWFFQRFPFGFSVWPEISRPAGATYLVIPLWMPLLLFAHIAWRCRRRIIPPGCCTACGYDLAGLKACPECGPAARHM